MLSPLNGLENIRIAKKYVCATNAYFYAIIIGVADHYYYDVKKLRYQKEGQSGHLSLL